jgi:hypothetical protein
LPRLASNPYLISASQVARITGVSYWHLALYDLIITVPLLPFDSFSDFSFEEKYLL